MRRDRIWSLVVLAAVAVIVEGVGLIGSRAWDATATLLRQDANAGAAAMIDSTLLNLPSAVLRSRRLIAADLASAERSRAADALEAVARRQHRWMSAHPESFLNRARARLIQGDAFEARTDLNDALDRDPTNPFSIRLLSLVTLMQGRYEDALELLAQAEAMAPGFRVPRIELTAEDQARVQLEGLNRRLEIYPRLKTETLIIIGQELRAAGLVDEANERLDQATGDPRADLVKARWALDDGDAPSAAGIALGLTLQRRLPTKYKASAWSVLAQALEVQGDSQGALSAAQRALRLAPESAGPHLALARIAQGRGDNAEAVNHLRRAWGMDPSNLSILIEFARAAERAGLMADARLALERAVASNPGDTGSVLRLVDFQLRTGALMEAVTTLSAALDRAPTDPGLLRMADRLRREVERR